jgi:two-component system, cell cycle response regulator DivK
MGQALYDTDLDGVARCPRSLGALVKDRKGRLGVAAGDASESSQTGRSVLLLDPDPATRARTEAALRDEDYWVFGTAEAKTAARLINVQAADLLLVDLGMAALDAVPRWERRRADASSSEAPPPTDAYAVLRPLQFDATAARYPLVVFRSADEGERTTPRRFGIVEYFSKTDTPALLTGLDSLFRNVVLPARTVESNESEDPIAALEAEIGPARPRAEVVRFPEPAAVRVETESALGASLPFDSLPRALRKALLVDPDAAYRRFLKNALGVHGFTVYEASTVEEAMRIAIARRPWLVLTEVNLPDESGFELVRRVRSHSLLAHTPLAFLSEWDDYEKRYHGMKLGADDYFMKPIPARELLIRLQLILKRYSDLRTRTRNGSGLEGGIELIGGPGVLQMCHISQLTGIFTARSGPRTAQIRFRDGDIISAHCDNAEGADAVYAFIAWSKGQFAFLPGNPGLGERLGESFDQLLLEGCRRLDESRRDPASSAY